MPAVWGKVTAAELLASTNGKELSGDMDTALGGISTDSRKIKTGDIFWALKGERYDGHDFVTKAITEGAVAAVVQQDIWKEKSDVRGYSRNAAVLYAVEDTLKALGDAAAWWRCQHSAVLTAITGSSGKTTTKEMTWEILNLSGPTLKNKGNFNNLIGLPLTLLQLENEHSTAVLEMGMNHRGEIRRLTEIASPDVGIITNVGEAHLEMLGDLEGVAEAKTELVEKIMPESKVAVNGDDAILLKKASKLREDLITFGLGEKNDVRAERIRTVGTGGTTFVIKYKNKSCPVALRVPGVQNVLNALAAATAVLCSGVGLDNIGKGLNNFSGVKSRFTFIPLSGDVTLVDDTYNSNPASLRAAVNSIRGIVGKKQRIIVGLGEMLELGDSTVRAHREAGRRIAELDAHRLIVLGEHARDVLEGAVQSGMSSTRVEAVTSRKEMALRILDEVRNGDLIFLKGSNKIGLAKVVESLRIQLDEE